MCCKKKITNNSNTHHVPSVLPNEKENAERKNWDISMHNISNIGCSVDEKEKQNSKSLQNNQKEPAYEKQTLNNCVQNKCVRVRVCVRLWNVMKYQNLRRKHTQKNLKPRSIAINCKNYIE